MTMKDLTANVDNTGASNKKAKKGERKRYFLVSSMRIVFLWILICVAVWVALELLFPRVTRAETHIERPSKVVVGGMEPIVTVPEEMPERMKGGTVGWVIPQRVGGSRPENCHIEITREPAEAIKEPHGVEFRFVYGEPVEFYEETLPVKVARVIDVIRAPDAAKDQLGMGLYDVDFLSASAYEALVEEFETLVQGSFSTEDDGQDAKPSKPLVAFVTPINVMEPTPITDYWTAMVKSPKFQFIGAPVQWTADLAEFFRYKASIAESFQKIPECASYDSKELIKAAMHSVIASAEGIKKDAASDFLQSYIKGSAKQQKMYLAITRESGVDLDSDKFGFEPIGAVSFRSAWEPALKVNVQH